MAYWERSLSNSSPSLDSTALSSKMGSGGRLADEFYEIESAVVLEVILDQDHPHLKSNKYKLIKDQWPVDINWQPPSPGDNDYTWVGRALVRLLNNHRDLEKEDLIWAIPLESNFSEYPLLNEVVGVISHLGQYYYTRKINRFNDVHGNADFNVELSYGGFRSSPTSYVQGNRELMPKPKGPKNPYIGPTSKLNFEGSIGYAGVLGRYFYYNPRIRALRRREGDLIIESRFGQSIRFAAYDDDRDKDKDYNDDFNGYTDYKGRGYKYKHISGGVYEAGGGNPMILIRNRQKPISESIVHEKNTPGYMLENINADGTSIHITSGITISDFQPQNYKTMWGDKSEEQGGFNGVTDFKYPKLMLDQIVINSDRVIISAKYNEMFLYSKKRLSSVTDSEYTIDAHNQIVTNTNTKTIINSPAIYLGEYHQTNEPALLGQTTTNWLYDLCNWLLIHTHWYKHTHPDAGGAEPDQTQTTVQYASLTALRNNLHYNMSRRVFVVGGGFAPGKNGGQIKDGTPPVVISIPSGDGCPGGFNGVNRKYSASEKAQAASQIIQTQAEATEAAHAGEQAGKDMEVLTKDVEAMDAIYDQLKNKVTKEAKKMVDDQYKLATDNADKLNSAVKEAKNAAKTAATTDNDMLREQMVANAKQAADKAKRFAAAIKDNLAVADSAIYKAQQELARHIR